MGDERLLITSDGKTRFHAVVIPASDARFTGLCLEEWSAAGIVNARGKGQADTEAEALALAQGFCREALASREAAIEAEKGELLETLANGLELRRKPLGRTGVYLGLFDPRLSRGPWRASAHDQWCNRKGEPRWLLSRYAECTQTGRYKTEAGALAALRSYGEGLTP